MGSNRIEDHVIALILFIPWIIILWEVIFKGNIYYALIILLYVKLFEEKKTKKGQTEKDIESENGQNNEQELLNAEVYERLVDTLLDEEPTSNSSTYGHISVEKSNILQRENDSHDENVIIELDLLQEHAMPDGQYPQEVIVENYDTEECIKKAIKTSSPKLDTPMNTASQISLKRYEGIADLFVEKEPPSKYSTYEQTPSDDNFNIFNQNRSLTSGDLDYKLAVDIENDPDSFETYCYYVPNSPITDVDNSSSLSHYPYDEAKAILVGTAANWGNRFKRPRNMPRKNTVQETEPWIYWIFDIEKETSNEKMKMETYDSRNEKNKRKKAKQQVKNSPIYQCGQSKNVEKDTYFKNCTKDIEKSSKVNNLEMQLTKSLYGESKLVGTAAKWNQRFNRPKSMKHDYVEEFLQSISKTVRPAVRSGHGYKSKCMKYLKCTESKLGRFF